MRLAIDSADPDAWLTAALALYGALERLDPDAAGRAQLRAELIVACDEIRLRARSRMGRGWVAETTERAIAAPLQDLLDDHIVDVDAVFELTESARARVLLDALSGAFHGDSTDPRAADLDAKVMAFAPDVDASAVMQEMRLVSAVRSGFAADGRNTRQESLDALECLYAGTDLGFTGGGRLAGLADVQRRLAPDEVLVEYVAAQQRAVEYSISALVVTAEAVALADLPIPVEFAGGLVGSMEIDGRAPVDYGSLGNLVVDTRLAVQRADRDKALAAGRLLHEVLIEPVLASGLTAGRDQWIIVPHRQLHPAPWMALIDAAGTPWIAHRSVTIAPSASVWRLLVDRLPTGRAALALGNPLLGYAGLADLPEAAQEVEHLRAVWQTRGWQVDARVGARATRAALEGAAGAANVVHLASHGSFPRMDGGASHEVLLSWAPKSPGRLTLSRLRELDLAQAWCTTLSVCDGGVYLVGPGDEPLGLVAAALEARTTTVVAAQWAVDDAAGRKLMGVFVDRLAEGGPASALRDAALAVAADPDVLPRDWASFVAIGSGRGPTSDT